MHDNDDSPTTHNVDIDINCLRDTSHSNESFSFLKGTSTHGDSKVFFNGLNGRKFYYNSSQDKIGFIPHKTDDIPVTGIMQTIAVIVNIIASWTIIIVMHIINTMIEGALVVDCCRMMMNKTMIASIGE